MADDSDGDAREQSTLMAVAAAWVSRITTISLEMVLPGLGGIWLDKKLGTVVLFTLLGFGLGMTLALWQLTKISQSNGSVLPGNPPGDNESK